MAHPFTPPLERRGKRYVPALQPPRRPPRSPERTGLCDPLHVGYQQWHRATQRSRRERAEAARRDLVREQEQRGRPSVVEVRSRIRRAEVVPVLQQLRRPSVPGLMARILELQQAYESLLPRCSSSMVASGLMLRQPALYLNQRSQRCGGSACLQPPVGAAPGMQQPVSLRNRSRHPCAAAHAPAP